MAIHEDSQHQLQGTPRYKALFRSPTPLHPSAPSAPKHPSTQAPIRPSSASTFPRLGSRDVNEPRHCQAQKPHRETSRSAVLPHRSPGQAAEDANKRREEERGRRRRGGRREEEGQGGQSGAGRCSSYSRTWYTLWTGSLAVRRSSRTRERRARGRRPRRRRPRGGRFIRSCQDAECNHELKGLDKDEERERQRETAATRGEEREGAQSPSAIRAGK